MSQEVREALREHGFDALYANHTDGVVVVDPTGRVVDCNATAQRMLRRSRTDIVGNPLSLPITSPSRPQRLAHLARALGGARAHFVARVISPEHPPGLLDVTLIPTRAASGAVTGVLAVMRDVTEVAELSRVLDASEGLNRVAGEIARFAGWRYDVATNRTRWTDGVTRILGAPPEEFADRPAALSRFLDARHHATLERAFARCVSAGVPFDLELELVNTAGQPFVGRLTGEPVYDEGGSVVQIQGALIDVSEERRQTLHREAMEQRVVETLDEILVPLFIVGRDWRVSFVNRAGLDMLGVDRAFLTGDTIWNRFPDLATGRLREVYEAAMLEGVPGHVVVYVEFFDRWFDQVVLPSAEGIVVSARDVTAEHAAEARAREFVQRASFLTSLMDLSRDAMIVRDFERGITYWNRAAEDLYGWTFEEVFGRSTVEVLFSDAAEAQRTFEAVMRDGVWRGELHHRARDGREIIVDCRLQLIYGDGGTPIGLFGANSDVTALARERERRIRSQRMESIGTLAGGIAHDLNNVLAPVLMSIELLARDEPEPARRRILATMESSVHRGAEMIRQVLSFARGAAGERQHLSMSVLLFEYLQFCRDSLPGSIELVAEVPDDLHAVVGDATQLLQVLVNLATNARDAMSEGGRLTVRAHNEASRSGESPSAVSVVVEVSDTGSGMTKEVLKRAFEPFFTTKAVGEGTGLGLATSRGIVVDHGGRLEVISEPGRGSTFRVVLPALEEATAPLIEIPPAPAVAGRRRRVLVVDDEPAILMAVDEVLRAHDFIVDVAQDGVAALATLEATGLAYDLVLTDLNMPRLGGLELMGRLGEAGSTAPVVLMSGVGDRVSAGTAAGFLAKPFSTADLLEAVVAALGDD
ncbi:MAG TPA: PAS domain-containing protein [Acidimicrobiales bacterium]|nr:PAS domain-containing protein [Acidimicrobiales bacterium]